jgi:uncharacterized protein (TIGR02284 family)
MATSVSHLPAKSINWLQDLIQVNIDSRDGFEEAADKLTEKNSSLATLFRQMSMERGRQADELQEIVANNAEDPQDSGSVAAAVHRGWIDLRAALGGGEHAILSEAERGEDHIKGKYESAIQDLGTCSCVPTLRRQYSSVKAAHDKVKALRDSSK